MPRSTFFVALGLGLFVAACGRHAGGGGGEAQEPAPDNRNAGQVIVDILTSQGYACAAGDSSWTCNVPGDAMNWPLSVSYISEQDGSQTIWIDSYATRAFGHKCAEYINHMTDLAVAADQFSVSCDDGTQTFRMNTAFTYANAEVMSWMNNHLSHRQASWQLLLSARALRK